MERDLCAIVFGPRKGPRTSTWATLLFVAPLIVLLPNGAHPAVWTGSATVRVTDDGMTIDRFDRESFPGFARESLARYFKVGGKVNVVTRASGQNSIQDLELVGPSRCLASDISRSGWQKLRLEFSYKIDDAHFARTSQVRFELLVRFISGQVADFQQDHEPPAERFRQISPSELTDLANKLGGFMRREITSACFDKSKLTYCAATAAEPCQ